jgi:hypothetical protein
MITWKSTYPVKCYAKEDTMSSSTRRLVLMSVLMCVAGACSRLIPTPEPKVPSRILFVGDSSIYYNKGHAYHLQKLAALESPPLEIEAWDITRPLASLKSNWEAPSVLAQGASASGSVKASDEIRTGNYDAVVLHTAVAYYQPEVEKEYAGKFAAVIKDAGADTVLYMGWPLDPSVFGGSFDPAIQGVRDIAEELGVEVAPVAMAWEREIQERPDLDLYEDDAEHPTIHGTYLGVCVVYSVLFDRSPVGLPYEPTEGGGVTEEEARFLQRIAWETVQEYEGRE